jgi:hypothetical protein
MLARRISTSGRGRKVVDWKGRAYSDKEERKRREEIFDGCSGRRAFKGEG